ncbi:hypothetical protein PHYSODRAFT_286254, partial [Phytophthora sojae]
MSATPEPTPAPSRMLEGLQASAAPQAAQGRRKSRLKGASNVKPSFAWTPRAAEVLLRLRYDTM